MSIESTVIKLTFNRHLEFSDIYIYINLFCENYFWKNEIRVYIYVCIWIYRHVFDVAKCTHCRIIPLFPTIETRVISISNLKISIKYIFLNIYFIQKVLIISF